MELTIRPQADTPLKNASTPAEILKEIGPGFYPAKPIAATRLQSGDIRLVLQNKDYAVRNKDAIQSNIQATILQQNYPIEVCGVPMSLGVKSGKDANNDALLRTLSTANGKLVPSIQFSRVSWIPTRTKPTAPKSRSSLILGVATPQHQAECARKGVLIDGQLYAARLYDYGLQRVRCFRCSSWGHTSKHCKAPRPVCGQGSRDEFLPQPG